MWLRIADKAAERIESRIDGESARSARAISAEEHSQDWKSGVSAVISRQRNIPLTRFVLEFVLDCRARSKHSKVRVSFAGRLHTYSLVLPDGFKTT